MPSNRRRFPRGNTENVDVIEIIAAASRAPAIRSARGSAEVVKLVLLLELVLLPDGAQSVAVIFAFLYEGRQIQQ